MQLVSGSGSVQRGSYNGRGGLTLFLGVFFLRDLFLCARQFRTPFFGA